jgi:hypothetical protein
MKRKLFLAAIIIGIMAISKVTYAEQGREIPIYNCPDGGNRCVTIDVGGGGKHIYHKGN